MKNSQDYYIKEPIEDVIVALSDKSLSYQEDREHVNDLVVNLVRKYLACYLEIQEDDFAKLRKKIRNTIAEKYTKHHKDCSAVKFLADIQTTSAIVKEIIFNDKFEKDYEFLGLDIGAGTGILQVAMLIAAKRAEIERINLLGIEKVKRSAFQSYKTLNHITQNEQHTNIGVLNINVLEHPHILPPFLSKHLNFWVSETICIATPAIEVTDTEVRYKTEDPQEIMLADAKNKLDPFPQILALSIEQLENFVNRVKTGNTAMWPDIINRDYKPDKIHSTIKLLTGTSTEHIELSEIGEEFYDYPIEYLNHHGF